MRSALRHCADVDDELGADVAREHAVVGFVNPVGADDHDLSTEIVLSIYYTSRYEPGPVE